MFKFEFQNKATSIWLFSIAMSISVVYFDLFLSFEHISFTSTEKEKTEWVKHDFSDTSPIASTTQFQPGFSKTITESCFSTILFQNLEYNFGKKIHRQFKESVKMTQSFAVFTGFHVLLHLPNHKEADHLS